MGTFIRKRSPQNPGGNGTQDKRARAIFDSIAGCDAKEASNPFQNEGRITKRNVGGVTRTIGLNTAACLAAIDQGHVHLTAIASVYELKTESVAKTMRELEQDGMVEAHAGNCGARQISNASKTFKLTSNGKDLIDEMECTGDAFYFKCRDFLVAARDAEGIKLEKAEGKDF